MRPFGSSSSALANSGPPADSIVTGRSSRWGVLRKLPEIVRAPPSAASGWRSTSGCTKADQVPDRLSSAGFCSESPAPFRSRTDCSSRSHVRKERGSPSALGRSGARQGWAWASLDAAAEVACVAGRRELGARWTGILGVITSLSGSFLKGCVELREFSDLRS